MITLIITPNWKGFKKGLFEFGNYLVILPQEETIICEMKCTSVRWALWDADLYLRPFFDKYFDKDNWITKFKVFDMPVEKKIYLREVNSSNDQIDVASYARQRNGDSLPPWSNEPDMYRGEADV